MDGRTRVEIKLRVKIPLAWSGRGRICCAHNQWLIVFFLPSRVDIPLVRTLGLNLAIYQKTESLAHTMQLLM